MPWHGKPWETESCTLAPPALLLVSAHRQSRHWDVHTGQRAAVVHDYGGFDPALRQVRYDIAIDPPGPAPWRTPVQGRSARMMSCRWTGPRWITACDLPLSRMCQASCRRPCCFPSLWMSPAELWQAGWPRRPGRTRLADRGLGQPDPSLPWVFRGHPTLGSAWTQRTTPPDQGGRADLPPVGHGPACGRGDRDAPASGAIAGAGPCRPCTRRQSAGWPLLLTAAMASASDAQWPAPTAWHEGVCLGGSAWDALVWEP